MKTSCGVQNQVNRREPTCDTTVTLLTGVAVGGVGVAVLVGGFGGTLAGLAFPPVVITVEFF